MNNNTNNNTVWKTASCGNIAVSVEGEVALVNEDGEYKILPQKIYTSDKSGGYTKYAFVYANGHSFSVHRLVADTFLPNPENKPLVHHIDGNSLNNSLGNLCWMTKEEHIQAHKEERGRTVGRQIKWNWELHPYLRSHRSVKMVDGDRVVLFPSLRKAAAGANLCVKTIMVHIENGQPDALGRYFFEGASRKRNTRIVAINCETGRRKTYNSLYEAALHLGVSQGNISRCLKYDKGHPYHLDSTGGYKFRYATRKEVA